jgi:hypothetical protein
MIVSSMNPSSFHQTVKFTATVKSSTTGTPAGSVTFKDGTTVLGSVALNVSGVATFSTANLSVASHSITAVYGGSVNFLTSASGTLTQTVKKAASLTTVVSSANPSSFHQTVTLTATVKSSTTGVPTGSVTFKDGTTVLGSVALNASGVATFSTANLTVASHSITAVYVGSVNFLTSTSATLTQTVKKANTTTKVVSSLNPSRKGQSVTFTATVAPAFGGVPGGTVTFKDGTVTLGTGTVNTTTLQAKFTTTTLAVATHHIIAVYGGNVDCNSSTSVVLNQIVNP